MKKIFIFAITLLFLPVVSHASSAIQLDDNSLLFTIDFSIENALFNNEIPVAAEYGVQHNERVDTIGYTIGAEEQSELDISDTASIVLSNQPLMSERYTVSQGTKGFFTLLSVVTFDEPFTANTYGMKITKLPYWLDERRTSVYQDDLDVLDTPTITIE